MIPKLEYSFDDHAVIKFCYDRKNKRIEIYFEGYYSSVKEDYVDTPCVWIIEDWKSVKVLVGREAKLCNIDQAIGVFELVLYKTYNSKEEFELHAFTLDNRYLQFLFKEPKLTLNPTNLDSKK